MAFFQFRRKIDAAKDYSFEEIPVFSTLTPSEQKIIEKKSRMLEFKRGDIVYEQGKDAEAFYVVITGRFRLFSKTSNGGEETLTHFHRSDHFGETSLLTNQPHSGTVEAKKDGLILKLEKRDFLSLIKEIPGISLHLSRSLGHRLTKQGDDRGSRAVKIAALYSRSLSKETTSFWMDMAASLNKQTHSPVLFVDFCRHQDGGFIQEVFKGQSIPMFDFKSMEPSRDADLKNTVITHDRKFDYLYAPTEEMDFEEENEKKITKFLTFLTYRYNFVLLRLPLEISHIAFKAMKHSDYVYLYSQPVASELGESSEAIGEFQTSFGFSKSEIRILIPKRNPNETISYEEQEEILGIPVFSIIPSKIEQPDRYEGTLRYISKELAGTLVGLVLGSGAAYGLAHIGVLRALEENGIEVDVIAGSSIGALVGSFWAAGYDSNQLEKLALSINKRSGFFKLVGFRDLSIAHKGFLKGNQVKKFIKSYMGDRTFQDLKVPVKVVAADLFTSEEVVFETGSVVEAIRASISIPGIFRPFAYQDKYMIDGGVIDPLPVRVLAKAGIKKIIAVNVLASPRDRVERNLLHRDNRRRARQALKQKNLWSRILARGFNQVQNRYAVNIFNVIMRTIQFMEYEIADSWGDQADVLIHAVVPEGHWAEFYSPQKFIQAGEERTREQIDNIKRLIAE